MITKRLYVLCFDCLLVAASYILAHLLRHDFSLATIDMTLFFHGLAVAVIFKPAVFASFSMYRSLWSYASLQDGITIFKAVTAGSVACFIALIFMREFDYFSRSILLMDWILLLGMVAGSRLVWRAVREKTLFPRLKGHRTIIVGAGEAGSLLLKEIRRQPASLYHIVGFVDDDKDKLHMKLHGIPVLGDTSKLRGIIRKYNILDVIIAMPSADRAAIRSIVDSCRKCQVSFKILPCISSLIDGTVSVSSIKDVEIEDLLGRKSVRLDEQSIASYLTGKKVLVSGAGGSIGSEICRQVARFSPYKLVLLDAAETPLYEIEKELASAFPNLPIIPIIADVRNRCVIESVFEEFTPEVVFHSAAYKHVPMMEYNPCEAVTNNVGGTRVLADVSHVFGVRDFVMISTDKAVNPTNVMGASKRAAELYVQSLATISKTCFTTVRFGNVLGSNGSVIPLFKEQIRNGGPITVTDKQVIRYFMTIPEASQLVLQAGCLGTGGDIFVLDMGEPVRIVDLAEELIRLSGLTPYEDIDIVFTGLRPGEKLFEELLISGEGIRQTKHRKIRILGAVPLDRAGVEGAVENLLLAAKRHDITDMMEILKKLVPEYAPSYTFGDDPPLPMKRLRPDLFAKPKDKTNVVQFRGAQS